MPIFMQKRGSEDNLHKFPKQLRLGDAVRMLLTLFYCVGAFAAMDLGNRLFMITLWAVIKHLKFPFYLICEFCLLFAYFGINILFMHKILNPIDSKALAMNFSFNEKFFFVL